MVRTGACVLLEVRWMLGVRVSCVIGIPWEKKKKKAEMEPVKNSSSHNFTQDPNDSKLVLFVGFSHFTLSAHCFMRL